VRDVLLPGLEKLPRGSRPSRKAEFKDIIKIGRTHTQDATPLTLGQEFSGYATRSAGASSGSRRAARHLRTGPGRHRRRHRAQHPSRLGRGRGGNMARITGLPFVTAPNKFEALAAHDAMVFLSGALNHGRR
jgi:fumarate hydratase class II